MNKISLVVITKNEEKNIDKCLSSARFVDEIIVVDSGSTDRTGEIVKAHGGKFIFNPWPGYGLQKQFALEQATNNWVLLLDADEFLEADLAERIVRLRDRGFDLDAYRLARKQVFMHRICHYGKSVDHPVRLVNKNVGAFDLKHIHESFISRGEVGSLEGFMIHHSGVSVLERCKKIMRDLELELANNNSPDVTAFKVVVDPVRYFLSYYFRHRGFKDGLPGFVMTMLFSIQIFLQNAGQLEKNLTSKMK